MKFTLFLYFHLAFFYLVCQSTNNIKSSKGLWDNLGKSNAKNNENKNDNSSSNFQKNTQNLEKDLFIDNLKSRLNINSFKNQNSPISDSSNDFLPFETKLDQDYKFLSENRTNITSFWKQDHIDLLEHGKKLPQIINNYPAPNNHRRKNGNTEVHKIEKYSKTRQTEVPQIENNQQQFGESTISEVMKIHK